MELGGMTVVGKFCHRSILWI